MKLRLNARIQCKDGFGMSVQANEGAYCFPRSDFGPYKEVEVGFPSIVEESIMGSFKFLISPFSLIEGMDPTLRCRSEAPESNVYFNNSFICMIII